MFELNQIIRKSKIQAFLKERLPKAALGFSAHWRSPMDNYLIESQRQALENAFRALSLVEIDKDGDGFVCSDAMPQITKALESIRSIPDEFLIPPHLRRTIHAARRCCADASPQPGPETSA